MEQVHQNSDKPVEPKEVKSGYDVMIRAPHIIDMSQKTKWTPECIDANPMFTAVRMRRKTVEEWVKQTQENLQYFIGPPGVIVKALAGRVGFPEYQTDLFDPADFTLDSFLTRVQHDWNTIYRERELKPVLTKAASEDWRQFRERIITWCLEKGLTEDDDWILGQLKANAQAAQDTLKGQKVSSLEWATEMDAQDAIYNKCNQHSIQTIQSEPSEDTASTDEMVNYVTKEKRERRLVLKKINGREHAFTEDGRVICDKCKRPGHLARECRTGRRKYYSKKNQMKRLVYTIDDNENEPIVIQASICGQLMQPMLDGGAQENVVDIKTLRRLIPNVKLQEFNKTLIGADKKPRISTKCNI